MPRRFKPRATVMTMLLCLMTCFALLPLTAWAKGEAVADEDGQASEELVVDNEPSDGAELTAQFDPSSFKPNIVKIYIGKPITDINTGKKYLPVTVKFSAKEDLGNADLVHFLEGYVKASLKNGESAEGVAGLGLTLVGPLKPDVPLDSNMYTWEWKEGSNPGEGTGEGTLKYNVPLLEEGDTQSVEKSQATGQMEVNGLKTGDELALQIESCLKGVPEEMAQVKGNEAKFAVEQESAYPKEITVGQGDDPQPSCTHPTDKRQLYNAGDEGHRWVCTECGAYLDMAPHNLKRQKAGATIGKIRVYCTDNCGYDKVVDCDHPDKYLKRFSIDSQRHCRACTLCGWQEEPENHLIDQHVPVDERVHRDYCGLCSFYKDVKHTEGRRTFKWYKYSAMWLTYYVYYTSECTVCGVSLTGYIPYKLGISDWWVDLGPEFEKIINDPELDDWRSHSVNFMDRLFAPVVALHPASHLVNVYDGSTVYSRMLFDGKSLATGQGQDVKAFNKNGEEITGNRGPLKAQGMTAQVLPGTEGEILEDDVLTIDLTDAKDDEICYVFNGKSLEAMGDGEHTVTFLMEARDADGTITDTAAYTAVFTVLTQKDSSGNDVKCVSQLVPFGNATDDSGKMVQMSLSADAVAYTGLAVEPPTVTVKKHQANTEGADEPISQDEYTLTYYRVSEDAEGGEVQTEIAANEMTEVGSYRVVATPAADASWTGSVFSDFRVAYDLTDARYEATIADIPDQEFSGDEIRPTVKVTAKVGDETKELTQSGAWQPEEGGDGGTSLVEGPAGAYTVSYKDNVQVGKATVTVTGCGDYMGTVTTAFTITGEVKTQDMYRLYNPNSGEHFYTADALERDGLVRVGWNYEGVGWVAPATSATPVYRLYSGTDHHYTTNAEERDVLLGYGWKDEGIGWYSDDAERIPLYRQFNPNVDPTAKTNNSGSHNYTTSKEENDSLVAIGWHGEGIGWYAVEGGRAA